MHHICYYTIYDILYNKSYAPPLFRQYIVILYTNMAATKKRGTNRKSAAKQLEEDLEMYQDARDTREFRSSIENFMYLSPKEKAAIQSKFSKPKNASQGRYIRALEKIDNKIIIATGPAGTGKTLFATEYGLRQYLAGKYEKIIFTRPAVSVDEDLGYLPGTLEEKMAPWIRPIYDILYRFLSVAEVSYMINEKKIEIAPLAYMRGRTFKNTWIIADEMQNSSQNQMKMLLTRLGENSRMVITGDLDQHDRVGEINGLQDFLEKFRGCRSNSISSIEFETRDIEREEVVKEILDIYGCGTPELYISGSGSPKSQSSYSGSDNGSDV